MEFWVPGTPSQDLLQTQGLEIGRTIDPLFRADPLCEESSSVDGHIPLPQMLVIRSHGEFADLPSGVRLYIPAGHGGNLDLVAEAAVTCHSLYIALNGLGAQALAALVAAVPAHQVTFIVDARPLPTEALYDHIMWLTARGLRPGLCCQTPEQAALAALLNLPAVLFSADPLPPLPALLRLLALQARDAPRPLCAEEADAVFEREACLSVSRTMHSGDTLDRAVLKVTSTDRRGISPFLAGQISGKTLRYAIHPGEALTFGHLDDPS